MDAHLASILQFRCGCKRAHVSWRSKRFSCRSDNILSDACIFVDVTNYVYYRGRIDLEMCNFFSVLDIEMSLVTK